MENIQVCVRFRPLLSTEISAGEALKILPSTAQVKIESKDTYNFDVVFEDNATNLEVFNRMVQPLLQNFIQGQNLAIFTYGHTSSGKTHTMLGSGLEKGLTEMTILEVFKLLEGNDFDLQVSCLEIYLEQIRDLLDPSKSNLRILGKDDKIHVENLSYVRVLTAQQALECFRKGKQARVIGDNKQNSRSSRSHVLFQMRLNLNLGTRIFFSELNLVDLAGSECRKNTDPSAGRVKEGNFINTSLLVLMRCVSSLKKKVQPYRESALTGVLQGSLNTRSGLVFICTATAASTFLNQTRSTLKFGNSTKQIRIKPETHEILLDDSGIGQLQTELQKATQKIERLKDKNRKMKEILRDGQKDAVEAREKIWDRGQELRVEELQDELIGKEQEISDLREKCSRLEREKEEEEKKRMHSWEEQKGDLEYYQRLAEENRALRVMAEENKENYDRMIQEKVAFQSRNRESLGVSRDYFGNDRVYCEKENLDIKNLKAEYQGAQVELEKLRNQIAHANNELHEKNKFFSSEQKILNDKCQKLHAKVSVLMQENTRFKEFIGELEVKIRTLEVEKLTLTKRATTLDSCLDMSEKNNYFLKLATPGPKKVESGQCLEKVSRLKLKIAARRDEIATLKGENQKMLKERSDLQSLYQDRYNKCQELEMNYQHQEEEYKNLQHMHQELLAKRSEPNKRNSILCVACERKGEKNDEVNEKVRKEIEEFKDRVDFLSSKIGQLESDIREKSKHITQLMMENNKMSEENLSLKAKFDSCFQGSENSSPASAYSRIDSIGDL